MPCCCVIGCHNRAEKGHKLYKLPQGNKNETRRKLWIQNIGRKDKLPLHAYVCQDHFTDDQFELGRADHKRLLKWNAVPTIFFHCETTRYEKPTKQETVVILKHETIDIPEEIIMEENLESGLQIETKVEIENHKNNYSDEVEALKRELNASRKEVHTLRIIISQLQTIIERLVEETSDENMNDPI